MSFRGFLRPGQGFRLYNVLRRKGGISEYGRATTQAYEVEGQLYGIISQASQAEREQWKQNGHPITHKVIQRGTANQAQPTDVLELDGTGRRFFVQGLRDPGEIGHFTVYYTEERLDLNETTSHSGSDSGVSGQ